MMFCLEDGTALLQATGTSVDPNATLVMPTARVTAPGANAASAQAPTQIDQPLRGQPFAAPGFAAPPSRKSPLGLILGLGVVVILGISGIVIAFVVMNTRQGSHLGDEPGIATSSPAPGDLAAAASPSSTAASSPDLARSPAPISSPGRTLPGPIVVPASSSSKPETRESPAPQPKQVPRAPISGGVLNGKAVHLVQPPYPAIARQAHASGTVVVQVTIDEDGNVISAHPVSGHPLLQAAATAAARASKFSPTRLSGQPVKVIGIIQYNFVAQ